MRVRYLHCTRPAYRDILIQMLAFAIESHQPTSCLSLSTVVIAHCIMCYCRVVEFTREVRSDLSDYDADGGAWPLLFDEFVEDYKSRKR